MAHIESLKAGDQVELMYRDGTDTTRAKWYRGEVIIVDDDCWPLVKLDDGQLTEVRPFMTWRTMH